MKNHPSHHHGGPGRPHSRHGGPQERLRRGPDRDGFGRGPGRVFAAGDLRLVLLSLMGEQPRYGYELMKAIEEAFDGAYTPSAGSVYPTLTLLEETGLIAGQVDAHGKRRYAVTPEGQQFLDAQRATVESAQARMRLTARAMAGARPPEAIFQAMQTLKTALRVHRGTWDAAEIARVAAVIELAASQIQGVEA